MSKKPQTPTLTNNNQPQLPMMLQAGFSSPYPLPIQLDAFEKYAPGTARDVIATAQESIRHQQKMNELSLQGQIQRDLHMNTTL